MEKDFSQDEEKSLTPQPSAEHGDSSQAQSDVPGTTPTIQQTNHADEPTVRSFPQSQPTAPVDAPFHNNQTEPFTQSEQSNNPVQAEGTVRPSVPNYVTGAFPPTQPNYTSGSFQPPNYNYPAGPLQAPNYNYPAGSFQQTDPNRPQNYNPYTQPPNNPIPNYALQPQRPPQQPKQPGKLAQPLPLWAFLGGIVLIVALLIVLHLTGSDWAAGALHASYAALFIGTALIIALITRYLNGLGSSLNPTRRRQQVISISCILLIFIYSFVAQALQPTLHVSQGQALENQQQWQSAINEYTQGGEQAPTSVNLARTYTSWGLALDKQGHHEDASGKFLTVITQFNSPETATQLKRAQDGDINARLAPAQQNMQAKNYSQATSNYDTILQLAYCTAACKTKVGNLDATAYTDLGQSDVQKKDYQNAANAFDAVVKNFPNSPDITHVRALDATTYYNLGKAQLQAKNYSDAVTSFDTLKNSFPNAPEVKQSHNPMSQSLLGYGQKTRATNCSNAIPIYQRLAKEYGDTADGHTAQSALNAPQTVTGHFTNVDPSIPFSQIALTQGLQGGMGQDALFNNWDNASMKTDIDSNGNFTFTGIAQGTYNLLWYANDGTYEHVEFIYSQTTLKPFYNATVGPLCSVDVGEVSNSQANSTT